eukprot:COSAG01_NODE_15272_length_1355_cov_5.575637_1_plen_327_part_00
MRAEAAGNISVTSTVQTATLGANPSNKSSPCDQASASHADHKKAVCTVSTHSETVSQAVEVQNPDRCSGTSERGSNNSKSPDYQSGQTFRNAGYNAKQCKLEPAVVQLVKYRIDGISDSTRTPVQLQQAYTAAAAACAKDIKIQNVLPLHEDTKFCLKCPAETAAYSATDINSLGHLPTSVQTGILDTGASGHIVKSPAQMATSRPSTRVFAGFNGSTAEASKDGTVNMYLPGYDGSPGQNWEVDASTMTGVRQNLISVGQICKRLGYWLFLRGHDVYMPPKMREMLHSSDIPSGFEGFIRWRTDKNSPSATGDGALCGAALGEAP